MYVKFTRSGLSNILLKNHCIVTLELNGYIGSRASLSHKYKILMFSISLFLIRVKLMDYLFQTASSKQSVRR